LGRIHITVKNFIVTADFTKKCPICETQNFESKEYKENKILELTGDKIKQYKKIRSLKLLGVSLSNTKKCKVGMRG
jgi:hypothetical protein